MALTDKNILITPNVGNTADPQIVFSAADANTTAQQITVKAYPTSNGTLSFEASNGQLFSITNSMTGTIFSVNDVSGIPSIEVLDTGDVKIAQYGGNILLGGTTAVKIPVGTTAQQPSSPTAGMLRFSSSNTSFEGYNGTTWGTIGGATISDDNTTNATYYPVFVTANTGSASTVKVSSSKLSYNPSSGLLYVSNANNVTALGGATNPIIAATGNSNNYIQTYQINYSNTQFASSDFIAYPNNGNDSNGWIDMGITSNVFSQASYSVTGRNEGYIFMSAPGGSGTSGNLVFATDSTGLYNTIEFVVGGFNKGKTNSNVKFTTATTSTSNTTGTVIITGGLGITGNIYSTGIVTGTSLGGTISTPFQNTITTMTGLTGFGTSGVVTTAVGDVVVSGNLTVNGTTTTINANTITTNDKNINVANNQTTSALVDGAGIDIGSNQLVTWRYNHATTSWQSNVSVTPAVTNTLSLGGASNYWSNLYATNIYGTLQTASQTNITGVGTITSGTWSGSFGAVSGANLTNLTAGNLTGTIPSSVLGNSTHYVGTTAITLNRASASQTLTGVSIDGTANIANYDTVTTATTGTYYPQLALGVSGTFASYSNTAFTFNAATGGFTANTVTANTCFGSSLASGTLTLRSTSNATKATAGILMDEGIASTSTTTGTLVVTGGVGISGALNAATKSFIIPHPTKKKHLLKHGSLEGPEFGVYVRGKVNGNVIELPDYWSKLIDPDSITVQLTPIGKHQKLYVDRIEDNKVYIGNEGLFAGKIEAFYMINAERIDVNKLDVEAKE